MISKQEFFKHFHAGQNQYTYFLMAIDASAIGYALNKIEGQVFNWTQLLYFGALICWGISFLAGINFQKLKNEALLLEYTFMDLREGNDPAMLQDKQLIDSESIAIKLKATAIQEKMHFKYNLINIFVALGIVLFVGYEIWQMAIRSLS